MQKPIRDMAKYIKDIIPMSIPEAYPLKPMFRMFGEDEAIRTGVVAYRDFLYIICDRLIADGDPYDRPPRGEGHEHASLPVSYPFINNVKSVLFNIGYHGEAEKASLIIRDPKLLAAVVTTGKPMKGKLSAPKIIEALRFLSGCGVQFGGIHLDVLKPDLSKVMLLNISYPTNPVMLTGLKVMANAQYELGGIGNHDIFLRCDYRELTDREPDITAILKDYINPLPADEKEFVLALHQHSLDIGMRCKADVFYLGIRLIYFRRSKEIWTISLSLEAGFRVIIKADNTAQYASVVESFHQLIRGKITKGYGCDKKLHGLPCQKGCHGFSFALDDTILDLRQDMELWLDHELLYSGRK